MSGFENNAKIGMIDATPKASKNATNVISTTNQDICTFSLRVNNTDNFSRMLFNDLQPCWFARRWKHQLHHLTVSKTLSRTYFSGLWVTNKPQPLSGTAIRANASQLQEFRHTKCIRYLYWDTDVPLSPPVEEGFAPHVRSSNRLALQGRQQPRRTASHF